MHGDAGRADGVSLGLQATRRIDRQLAGLGRPALRNRLCAMALFGKSHRFVDQQLGDGETVVHLDDVQVVDAYSRPRIGLTPGCGCPFELGDVPTRHRQEIVDVRCRAEQHRLVHSHRGLDVGENDSGRAVGHG